MSNGFHVVGQPVQRLDALGHVTGRTRYFEDTIPKGLLHLKMHRSERHHAMLLDVDTSAAEAVKGVVKVLTHKDVPNNWYTILKLINVGYDEEPVLAEDRVLYYGEPIVAVVATSERAALEGAAAVKVTYEDLPAVFDVEEAIKPETIVIKPHGTNYFVYEGHHCRRVRFGDVEQGFAEADHSFEFKYQSRPIEQAPTETTGCIVEPQHDGRLKITSDTQACFFTLDNTALILDVPFGKLQVVGGTVGGGFGGKVDVIVEPIACIAAMATNRPVKFVYDRYEEMQVSSPRAAERIYIKDGVMNDGRIVARKVTLYADAGAYSRHSPYAATKAAAHMPGPYTIPNVYVDSYCVYTNRTPSSAMRGFGVTIGDFALESQMDRIARELDLDPLQLRLMNAYRDGDMKAHRKVASGHGADRGHPEGGGTGRPRTAGRVPVDVEHGGALMALLRGRGYASVNYPTGMNLGGDPTQALVHSTTTGNFVVSLSSVDLGQGLKTVAAQVAAETLGLPYENIIVDTADTDTGPHCMGTFASRGTHRVGNAVIMAAQEARVAMLEAAAEELEVDAEDLETDGTGFIKLKGSDEKKIHIVDLALAAHFKLGRTISGRGIFLKERSYPDPETGEMDPDSAQAHACTVADVEVDDETGEVDGARDAQRLRGRADDQPGDGQAADRGRRVDGCLARAVRDDRALLPGARPRPAGLRGVPDAGSGGQRDDGVGDHRAPGRRTARSARRASAR